MPSNGDIGAGGRVSASLPLPRWSARIARLAGAYAVPAGLIALAGWIFEIPRLTDWKNDGISMFPNTAVCAVASGLALLVATTSSSYRGPVVRLLAVVLAVFGGLTLFEHLSGIGIGIDTLILDRPWGQSAAVAPMRMGPPASLSFLIAGTALLLLTFGTAGRRASAALGLAIVAIGMLSLTGHVYGASPMYTLPRLTGIAMQTASVVVAVGIGIVASVPEREPMRTLLERGAAGVIVRRALPITVVLAFSLGMLRVRIQEQGLVDTAFGTALRTLIELFLLAVLLWWAAARVRHHERARQEREAEVRRQARQLSTFLETAAIGLHRAGSDGIILWANDAELQMLGYDRDDYVGHHVTEFHVDRDTVTRLLARLHRGENVYEQPARMRCKDGSVKHVVIDSTVLWDEGRFVHTQSFMRDVTERHDAERLQTLLAAIIETSDDAIVSKTLDGVITSWNAGAERMFGYTREEAVEQRIDIIIPPDRLDEERQILKRLRRGDRIDHYETIRRRKDGTLVDISLSISPIVDRHGTVIGASKIARNVTDRKRAAARIALDQDAMARLYEVGRRCVRSGGDFAETLAEVLDAAVWIAGADKGTLRLYDAASGTLRLAAQVGFSASFAEVVARVPYDRAVDPAVASGDRVVVEDVATSPVLVGPSSEALRAAGVASVQSTPLLSSDGAVLGIISTHWVRPHRPGERECRLLDVLARQAADYIERKLAEEQREELLRVAERAREEAERGNRAKDEFLAMLGHELRNPLSAVRNAIAAASLDEAQRARALEIARRQTDQLGRIVDDLLDVARIARGRVPLRKDRAALADVLQRTVDGARGLLDERGHTLTLALPAEPIHLEADAARLEQAVGNLLTNAAKYTDPGGRVAVIVERDGDEAIVRVRDNGMGIAPDVLPHIFELFTQGERLLDRAQGGLGIGLTLVRRIIELHGGTIEAHSAGPGQGAEFVVRLRVLPTVSGATAAHERPLPRQHAPARVLMVEDNPDAAESLVMILELLGHHVRVVHDGMAAVEAARANRPDIMLIDIGLPGMSGYEVAQAIRRDPALKHLVLVALTGYGRPEDKAEAIAAGFDYHLVKPVDLDALGALVAQLGMTEATARMTRH